ncbi:MAG: HisA/HisF-related TIM barrel protein [Sphingosinicella sp.]
MFRPRLIALILLKGGVAVKSLQFGDHLYVGDPINAIRLFNSFEADELLLLDIDARGERRIIAPELLRDIAEEAMMPFGIGGGISSLGHIETLVAAGCEKVVIGSQAVAGPDFVARAAAEFGSSTISVCIDVRDGRCGKTVCSENGSRNSGLEPAAFARMMEDKGAGEIIVQSIDRDGTMAGYDLELVHAVSAAVAIPVVALGGAGGTGHFREACRDAHASAAAAGSAFVFLGKRGSVLINYPEPAERRL